MVEFVSPVKNKIGIHLRAAGEFVKVASQYACKITVLNDGRKANGKSILGLAGLAIATGTNITIQVDGKDEEEAKRAIEKLIDNNFNED
jgi:phosphocarrier protein HPr